jgi:hypothetical protein
MLHHRTLVLAFAGMMLSMLCAHPAGHPNWEKNPQARRDYIDSQNSEYSQTTNLAQDDDDMMSLADALIQSSPSPKVKDATTAVAVQAKQVALQTLQAIKLVQVRQAKLAGSIDIVPSPAPTTHPTLSGGGSLRLIARMHIHQTRVEQTFARGNVKEAVKHGGNRYFVSQQTDTPTQRPTEGPTQPNSFALCKMQCCHSLKYVEWGYIKCEGELLHSPCGITNSTTDLAQEQALDNTLAQNMLVKAAAAACNCGRKTCSNIPTPAPTSFVSVRRAILRFNALLNSTDRSPAAMQNYSSALATLDVAVTRLQPSSAPTHPTNVPTSRPTGMIDRVLGRLGEKDGELSVAAQEFDECFSVRVQGTNSQSQGVWTGEYKYVGISQSHARYQHVHEKAGKIIPKIAFYEGRWRITGSSERQVFASESEKLTGGDRDVALSVVSSWVDAQGESLAIEVTCHSTPPLPSPKSSGKLLPPVDPAHTTTNVDILALTLPPKSECTTVAVQVCPRMQTQELCYQCMTRMPACQDVLTNAMLIDHCTKFWAIVHNTSAPTAAPTETWMLPSRSPTMEPTSAEQGAADFDAALDGVLETQIKQSESASAALDGVLETQIKQVESASSLHTKGCKYLDWSFCRSVKVIAAFLANNSNLSVLSASHRCGGGSQLRPLSPKSELNCCMNVCVLHCERTT